jgi:hypothetical protein
VENVSSIAIYADWLSLVVHDVLDPHGIEANDHAREVIGAKPCESMVHEDLGSMLSILHIAYKIDGLLITADIP